MSQQQISRSNDLKQLRDEGYEIEIRGGYLIVHHVPYVNNCKEIQFGKLIVQLSMVNNLTVRPADHIAFFMGDQPCNNDGTWIAQIQHSNPNAVLFDDIVMNCMFSNKPANGYTDYYHKVTGYVNIISAPAASIDSRVTPRTFNVIEEKDDDNVFRYYDTHSSRANIYAINSKLIGQKIAVVGLGGTGSYILDLLAKTPVKEIHLFDADLFLQHNAFRYPGAASSEQLERKCKKVEYLAEMYLNLHKGVIPHPENITQANISLLNTVDFVFLAIDNNEARKLIIEYLLKRGISFIDVGLGVNTVDDRLIGQLRVTTGTAAKNDHIDSRVPFDVNDDNAEYRTNIQIAELNAFNAVLAIIKWKKLLGFYQDLEEEYHSSYSINVSQLINEDSTA